MKPVLASLIFAYLSSYKSDNLANMHTEGIDVVNFSFASVQDGRVFVRNMDQLDRLLAYPGRKFKVVLSIGGWGADGFSDAVLTQESRMAFVDSIVQLVNEKDLDGVDLDWEYPAMNWSGIKARPEDTHNFTLFMEALRAGLDALPKKKLLTCAVGASPECTKKLEVDKLAAVLDYLHLMTYDMGGKWRGPTFTHHANLFPSQYSTNSAVETIKRYNEAGMPLNEMVLGCAFYGNTRPRKENGCVSRKAYPFKDIDSGMPGYAYLFDEEAKAPIYYNDGEYVTYDSPESIEYKCHYAKETGMAGIMFWELSYDNSKLVKAIVKSLR